MQSTIQISLNRKYNYKVSLLLTRKFISETASYTQRFIGKKKETKKNVHDNSEQPISFIDNMSYSRVLRLKRTCSAIKNLKLYCLELNCNKAGN